MNYDLNSDDPDLTTTYDVCVVGIELPEVTFYVTVHEWFKNVGLMQEILLKIDPLKKKCRSKKAKYAALTKGRSFRLMEIHIIGGLQFHTKLDLPLKMPLLQYLDRNYTYVINMESRFMIIFC